ncbi:MAG: hydrolase [Candidatus Parcubacteria bacterium]|nr:hydrolase [Candidatus Parcubacteria bacterium]
MKKKLPPDEYYQTLARVPTSAAAIIRNTIGEFMIVSHPYRNDGWHLPGGMTDTHETPRQAVVREVEEELGIAIKDPKLFCVEFATSPPYDRIHFVFNAGMLTAAQIADIKPDPDEISGYRFVSMGDMLTLLHPLLSQRFKNSFEGFLKGTCIYLENGLSLAAAEK